MDSQVDSRSDLYSYSLLEFGSNSATSFGSALDSATNSDSTYSKSVADFEFETMGHSCLAIL